MKTQDGMIRKVLFAAALLLSAAACVKENHDPTYSRGTGPMPEEIGLVLDLSSDGRAEVSDEDAIHSVHLFFEDLDENGKPTQDGPLARQAFAFSYPDGLTAGKARFAVNAAALTAGWKRIYVGANLSVAQAESFARGNSIYTVPKRFEDLKYGLSEAFAPGRGIGLVDDPNAQKAPDAGSYTRNDIAMFCVEGHDLLLEPEQTEYDMSGDESRKFRLERNVAKVLVTSRAASKSGITEGGVPGIAYCELKGDLLYAEGHPSGKGGQNRGWIRQGDVRFLVNALNLKSYVMADKEWNPDLGDNGKWEYKDPNYDGLTGYFDINHGSIEPIPNLRGDFYYNAVQSMTSVSRYYVKTLPHDESRFPSGASSDPYYEGLYCPENTFTTSDLSADGLNILSGYDYPWPMITHVSITAKFTPREIIVEKKILDGLDTGENQLPDDMKGRIRDAVGKGREWPEGYPFTQDIVIVDSPDEELSWAILTESLRQHGMIQDEQIYDHEKPGFTERTYFFIRDAVTDYLEFHTYGSARIITDSTAEKDAKEDGPDPAAEDPRKNLGSFTAMPRGRGYYYTYIGSRDGEGNRVAYADSQVERNTYYILTLNSFSGPGRTGSNPEFVKVHTSVSEWKSGGNAEIELN